MRRCGGCGGTWGKKIFFRDIRIKREKVKSIMNFVKSVSEDNI
jgi:hypothetical protein